MRAAKAAADYARLSSDTLAELTDRAERAEQESDQLRRGVGALRTQAEDAEATVQELQSTLQAQVERMQLLMEELDVVRGKLTASDALVTKLRECANSSPQAPNIAQEMHVEDAVRTDAPQ